MSILLTPQDVHSFVNEWQNAAIGKDATIQVADTSSLVSAGEAIMQSGMENTLNSLYLLLGRLWVSGRKYNGKGKIIQAKDTGVYTHRSAKISIYSRKAIASGFFNTDLYTNFAPGYTAGQNDGASVKSQWEQAPSVQEVFTFGGSKVYDFEAPTIYIDKIEQAFRNESEMAAFVNGAYAEFENDVEQYQENERRLGIVNRMAADIDMEADRPESIVHCVTEFNAEFNPSGTPYTANELKTVYAKEFYSWLAAKLKIVQARMTERSLLYHWSPTKVVNEVEYELLRHTPVKNQKIVMLDPDFTKMETYVLPEIFHDEMLKIADYERLSYWQNINEPAKISIYPAVNDTDSTSATYKQQIKGAKVDAEVLLMIFDEDALLVDQQLKRALTSPVEARKGYYNTFLHIAFNNISDATENSCVFVMD